MKQVQLGQSGPLVNRVGLGCMSFGGIYGATDTEESHRTLHRALELGVTHLDVANIYGMGISEKVIGSFLRDHPNARDTFVIATKAGIDNGPPRDFRNDEAYLRTELEGSLKRLGVDHVPLFYIHRRDQRIPVEHVMGTLQRFIEEGKIGAIGLSEIAPSTLARASKVHPIAAVQSEYSLWTRQPELGLLQMCEKLGTTFVSFSPVGRGIFGDRPPIASRFGDGDFRKHNPRFQEPAYSANISAVEPLRAFAQARGVPLPTLAIAWALAKVPNSITIPGTRSTDHLAQNTGAVDLVLTDDDLAEIEQLLPAGFAEGDRYSDAQRVGAELYC
ncbi:MAG: aldo/keto reductase [Pseudomonadota bacterium]